MYFSPLSCFQYTLVLLFTHSSSAKMVTLKLFSWHLWVGLKGIPHWKTFPFCPSSKILLIRQVLSTSISVKCLLFCHSSCPSWPNYWLVHTGGRAPFCRFPLLTSLHPISASKTKDWISTIVRSKPVLLMSNLCSFPSELVVSGTVAGGGVQWVDDLDLRYLKVQHDQMGDGWTLQKSGIEPLWYQAERLGYNLD